MMTELTTETELRFNVKTVSVEDMTNMLEKDGWKQMGPDGMTGSGGTGAPIGHTYYHPAH